MLALKGAQVVTRARQPSGKKMAVARSHWHGELRWLNMNAIEWPVQQPLTFDCIAFSRS